MSGTDLTPAPAPDLDANGFDAEEWVWVPIPRRRRKDGWKPDVQVRFIEALADTGSITEAAHAAGMSLQSCYRLRRAPGAEGFARAWDAAIAEAGRRLVDIAMERVVNGTPDPILDKEGNVRHLRRRYSDRLLMFMLRAHHPERYGAAAERAGAPAPAAGGREAAPPPAVAEALAALEPLPPLDRPHLLTPRMDPESGALDFPGVLAEPVPGAIPAPEPSRA